MVVREGGYSGRASHSTSATPVLAPGGSGTARSDAVAANGGRNGSRGCGRRDRGNIPTARRLRPRGARVATRGWCVGLPCGILPPRADGAARCRGDGARRPRASPRRASPGDDRDCRERADTHPSSTRTASPCSRACSRPCATSGWSSSRQCRWTRRVSWIWSGSLAQTA